MLTDQSGNSYRCSGRTTNILLRAVAQLLRGASVAVICYNSEVAHLVARHAWCILQAAIGDTLNSTFVTSDRIEVTIDNTTYFLYFVPFTAREKRLLGRDCYTWYDNNHTVSSMEWHIKEYMS